MIQLNSCLNIIKKYQKEFKYLLFFIIIVLCISYFFIFMLSKTFYYMDKDTFKQISEQRYIIKGKQETFLQALLRTYLDGSNTYIGKIPFMHDSSLLSISHDRNKKILVLNWDPNFVKVSEQPLFEKDITYLLKTIKKNTTIQKVYFVINNNVLSIPWKNQDLSSGILIKEVE